MSAVAAILLRRAIQALAVALLVATLCFAMVRTLPGDMAYKIAGFRYGYDMVTAASAEAVRVQLGLATPTPAAWAEWMGRLLHFDLGRSYVSGAPVAGEVVDELAHTLRLALAALALSLVIGPPLGIAAALRPGGAIDRIGSAASILLRCMPAFAIGIVLLETLAVRWPVLPAGGDSEPGSIVLPALTLALGLAATSLRVTRTAFSDIVSAPYFLFARTKGLPLRTVVWRHGLRNAAVPIVTYLGFQFAWLIEGVLVVEILFSRAGVGHALVHAILGRDVPTVQGTALCLGVIFVGLNTLLDLALIAIDPRLRGR